MNEYSISKPNANPIPNLPKFTWYIHVVSPTLSSGCYKKYSSTTKHSTTTKSRVGGQSISATK